jgi:alpha-beta hydrolase superfamily lysophospholipase
VNGGRRLFPGLVLALAVAGCTPTVMPAGPPHVMPAVNGATLRMTDGSELPLHVWMPADRRPRATVVALHGFNDYGTFFARPGTFLASRGIASYAYDQRGFGAAPNPGLWPGTDTLVCDLGDAVAAVRARHPGVPLFVVGESMGGAVAIVAATNGQPLAADGLILAAPAVWGRATMPSLQSAALWFGAHTTPGLTVTGRGLGVRASDNVEMLRALGRDPLVIKSTRIDSLYGLVGLMDAALAAAPRLTVSSLILYGERDEVVPAEPVRRFLAGLPAGTASSRRVAVYADGWHMLLRDLQAETVWNDIAAWIADRGAALPSGADARAAGGDACRRWNLCDKVPSSSHAGERS